jgi:hypothetical protein
MLSAPFIALMATHIAVLDLLRSAAMVTATAQLGIQRVEHLGVQRAYLDLADERPHVLIDVATVTADGALPTGVQVQVTIEQLVDRRAGARIAPLTDLREELDADRIRPPLSVRPRRDYFLKVVPTATEWVRAGIDTHPQSTTGKGFDATAWTTTAPAASVMAAEYDTRTMYGATPQATRSRRLRFRC